ncbi:hypothetical protein J2Z83_003224 [Virgibacillus natechei]|uniref:Uncharacterized protein n=1 Tax=Virgibacillus natechei TaxID=1216297 RepID=A0ABS4IJF7_9BACI|nr:hypothetical protein [Virgibacillus natechei]MBP1971087.1 hypothetical protein [Virgibacillus natechei]UZD13029.1 hypothetical protein OLD84_00165 [Virgibacillus natechei]
MCIGGEEKDMHATVEAKHDKSIPQSSTFSKLRQKTQNEMKRTNTQYEDVLKIMESIKRGE